METRTRLRHIQALDSARAMKGDIEIHGGKKNIFKLSLKKILKDIVN